MRLSLTAILVFAGLLSAGGCATSTIGTPGFAVLPRGSGASRVAHRPAYTLTAARQDWVRQQGGLNADPILHARLQQAFLQLGPGVARSSCRLEVLDSSRLVAYSWTDGSVFASRGLIQALDSLELTAALAHEMGHLLGHGPMADPSALQSHPSPHDEETRADQLGCDLLQQVGLPTRSMTTMLRKVRATLAPESDTYRNLSLRIARLDAQD
ncbi:MAG: M48 family metalloprotease [Phycisphaeraceae bacterium]